MKTIISQYKENGSLVTISNNQSISIPFVLTIQRPQQSLYPNRFKYVGFSRAASSISYLKKLAFEITSEYAEDREQLVSEDREHLKL